MSQITSQTVVCAMYKFVILDDYKDIRQSLLNILNEKDIRGTLLLANEGINGTVAGSRQSIDELLLWFKNDARLADIDYKESYSDTLPFKRTKVKLKKEIVTMGVEGIDPKHVVGAYLNAKEWNELLDDPDVVLIDTRNDYEYQVGTFKNAINPKTDTFRQLPDFVKENLDPKKHKKVAMFCTGGIRCEKSTAYMKQIGFEEVYHLKGGILKYLEDTAEEDTKWQGECFVFDDRVTVNHQLEQGNYDQCHACRFPITEADKASEDYERGVSCPHCVDKHTAEQKARFAEREKQMQLAQKRGEAHIGGAVSERIEINRAAKLNEKKQQQEADKAILQKQ